MRKDFVCFVFLLLLTSASAQEVKVLKAADDVASILGDKANSINKATVQSETEKTASIQVEFVGFKEKDKTYKIRGVMMNAKKVKMDEVEPVEVDLDPKAGLADLFFTFKQKPNKQYTTPFLESGYVQFSVLDKKGLGSSLGIENLGIDGKSFLFQYKKKWKLKGAAGQEVSVKLTPFKSAANIKQ